MYWRIKIHEDKNLLETYSLTITLNSETIVYFQVNSIESSLRVSEI